MLCEVPMLSVSVSGLETLGGSSPILAFSDGTLSGYINCEIQFQVFLYFFYAYCCLGVLSLGSWL